MFSPAETVRRNNFKAIVEAVGGAAELCKRFDMNQDYVRQLLKGKPDDPSDTSGRNIGHRSARSLEQKFGLPENSLDHHITIEFHGGKLTAAPQSQDQRLDVEMLVASILRFAKMGELSRDAILASIAAASGHKAPSAQIVDIATSSGGDQHEGVDRGGDQESRRIAGGAAGGGPDGKAYAEVDQQTATSSARPARKTGTRSKNHIPS